jgi:NADH-quinone oxidoreductase subunit F
VPAYLGETQVDYDSLQAVGAIMGSGGMVVMDETTCMVDMARFFLDFTKKESCGKCTFCRVGTQRMLEILVLSTIRYVRDEYEAHIRDKKCPAKKCKALITYEIIEDKCTGCTVCAKKCPVDAISGERKEIHHIDQEKCIKCGVCYSRCKFDAIRLT